MRHLIENINKNSQKLLNLKPQDKKEIILQCALNLRKYFDEILKANEKDLKNFTKNEALKDRLKLDTSRLNSLCEALEKIALLPDPIGKVLQGWVNDSGLKIEKVSIPIGIICVIYEARPAISAELLALLLKSSNAGILKGGSEAKYTNFSIFKALQEVLAIYDLKDCFLMVSEKEEINELLEFDDLIDLIVPRGSTKMIQNIAKNTKIPVIKHDKGLCHIFVDESANLNKAKDIILNAKCQRVSVCNALESLLIHENIAKDLLQNLAKEFEKFQLEIHACEKSLKFLQDTNLTCFLANEQDYATEWLDYKISIKIVKNLNEAIEHIQKFSSNHSEAILSNDTKNIAIFQRSINSSCVYVNASTRFSDGGEFGFGAEVGISTNKLHARGPMGVEELCTYKYLITGEGQVRK
ncbi:glutamate-5-semialdehyde dehydrogenase [Campylobacter sp. US33a]|uniref:Gamma-glutamyl phosphate reductase n=1 Tax=Campylobacter sp. CCS1377 TaxID=3158229 RepID=A0AAU7E5A0_9BACT|nr:glutamate-5-semialdehyde dehydrogenase [Campylobacter sp. US33a]TEY01577.1 glutamate-5-semialdehyde dehydrogenase [Campylobacter sp. US33a]